MVSSRSPGLRSEALHESSSVTGVNSGDTSAFLEANQPSSSSAWTRSEPCSLSSNLARGVSSSDSSGPYSASPERANVHGAAIEQQISGLTTDDEERYEAFGAVDDTDSPLDSESPLPSSIPATNTNKNPRSPNSMLLSRHTWLRTSLGRSPIGANRKRLSSNALASQLYRSSSFNSSGRGSICDTADDIYSDVSLEDDVIDLNHRVQMIQEQMHVLVDTQSAGEERYARVKQENATLQARILMLEEAAKDAETRAEERLDMEQRRHREWASRMEREKELQLENLGIKLQAAQVESIRARDESTRLREQLDKLKEEKSRIESVLEDARLEAERAQEAERRSVTSLAETSRELQRIEAELLHRRDAERKLDEMAQELANLQTKNKNLEESRDELQAAVAALQAGRELFMSNRLDDGPNDNMVSRKSSPSLATELLLTRSAPDQTYGIGDGESEIPDIRDNFTTLAEAKQALKEQREVNTRLRSYIDNILLNIVEKCPQLLEVKQLH